MKIGRRKHEISEGEMTSLQKALQIGAPIELALQYARIAKWAYDEAKETADCINKAIELGMLGSGDDELKAEGIDPQAVHDYNAKKDSVRACMLFMEKIEGWIADSVMYHLSRISNKDKFTNWQASAWMLERRYPQYFSKEDKQKETKPIESIKLVFTSENEERKAELEQLDKEVRDEIGKVD